MNWKNVDNIPFYESEQVMEELKEFVELGGLADGSDISLIENYIFQASSILEIGAGFGRVIEILLNKHLIAKISALERSSLFYSILREKFNNKIKLYHCDIKYFETDDKFDLLLWMWSGISDFSKNEQLPIINKLYEILSPDGVLIMDTFLYSSKPANASISKNQSYIIKSKDCKVYGYIPSHNEIEEYAHFSGFKSCSQIDYVTSTKRTRNLHILSK